MGTDGFTAVWWRIRCTMRNTIRQYLVVRPLQGMGALSVILVVWVLLGLTFTGVLIFLARDEYAVFRSRLIEILLAVFFWALFFLITFSDTILVWSSLFRSRSASYHAQLPVPERTLYWGAALTGGAWSGWGVLVLTVPLIGALTREAVSPWRYLPAAFAVLAAFIACCLAAGAVGALVLARLIPVLRRGLRGIIVVTSLVLLGAAVIVITGLESSDRPVTFIHDIVGRLAFAENPYLPPWWAQQALLAALQDRWSDWAYFLTLSLSTAAGLAVVGERLADRRLRRDIDQLTGRPERQRGLQSAPWRLLPFIPADLALLTAKDLRLFRRDPAQVLQFTLFFGMLGFYLLMLPRLGRAFMTNLWWRPVVSLLNLTAISMALATFTGRFVYPLLSLEGKRLWVLMLAPWSRERVVTAKLVFALLIGLPVSLGLVVLSGVMLGMDATMVAYQALVMGCLALGLSAGALGLGARLADYSEDNPARLVAGYGGTVNLLISLVFCGALLAGAALPLIGHGHPWWWVAGLGWTVTVTLLWTSFAMGLAWRWFAWR